MKKYKHNIAARKIVISLLHEALYSEKKEARAMEAVYYIFENYLIPFNYGVLFHSSMLEGDIFRRLKLKPMKGLKKKLKGVSYG